MSDVSRGTHEVHVHYTTDDDGIHLGCECGWDGQVLGNEFWPTPTQLIDLETAHLLQMDAV